MKCKKHDVVISFVSKDKALARRLADLLRGRGLTVVLDKKGGRRLMESRYCVVLFSIAYAKRLKTKKDTVQSLKNMSCEERLLPVLLEKVKIPEPLESLGMESLLENTVDEIAETIAVKVLNSTEDTNEGIVRTTDAGMNKTMEIIGEDGETETVDVLLSFEFTDTNTEYVVFTKNERDEEGNVDVYVSGLSHEDGETILIEVSDIDWPRIKGLLRYLSYVDDSDEAMKEYAEAKGRKLQ